MEGRRCKVPGLPRISGIALDIPKRRNIADERLSKALKKAVNHEFAPPGLLASVRKIFLAKPADT